MTQQETQSFRSPVVAVLGHVDHGKTSLLDAIRKSNVATREHGGITQAIGAYQITTNTKDGQKTITFIDTPGHEAFAKMRGRGVNASDIVLLVVASDDGIKPQTKESIAHIKDSKLPFIVVLTKADLPTANPDRVKQQLMGEGILLEGLGGDTPVISVSSKTGAGIQELLDLILLLAEVHGVSGSVDNPLEGVVIEAKKDSRKGVSATVIIRKGKIAVGEEIVADNTKGKVRALFTDTGASIKEAVIGMPIEVMGFEDVPTVGSSVTAKENAKTALTTPSQTAVARAFPSAVEVRKLPLIIKTDTQGSLEAISQSLPMDDVEVLTATTGEPTEADVLLAAPSNALIIGFNVKPGNSVSRLAENEGVLIKTYKLIYELLEELSEVIALYKEGKEQEVVLGMCEVVALFPFDKKMVAGSKVLEGRIVRGDKVKIERDGQTIGEARVSSLRVGKQDIGKVEEGSECGVLLSSNLDIQPHDVILSVR